MISNKLKPSIFKSYDIRGVYPNDINEEAAFEIGLLFSKFNGPGTVVVGRDMRLGSPALRSGLLQGLTAGGSNVHDIGLTPIDAVYFAAGKLNYDGGIMITASHNPKEYAGMKMIGRKSSWIKSGDLLKFASNNLISPSDKRGTVEAKNITEDYLKHVLSFGDIARSKPFKIVADAGNGIAGLVLPRIFEKFPGRLDPLFFELDGNFPNHPSNPLEPESQKAVVSRVREIGADLGIIMDGDTDRLFFVDERGNFIRADMTLLILAKEMLRRRPASGICYNVICSRAVPEMVKKMGGHPIRTKVGFVNVASAMREQDAIMGGELSAHYCFRDNFWTDSGFIALVLMIELLSRSDKSLSDLVKEFATYAKSDEINFKITNADEVITVVRDKYKNGRMDELDGVTVEYPNWWFNIRKSNTEPLLRVTIEADTPELLENRKKEVVSLIREIAKIEL